MSDAYSHSKPTADRARRLLERALVWDMVWPWEDICDNTVADLARFKAAGYNVISVTLAGDNHNLSQAITRICAFRAAAQADASLMLCSSTSDIDRAVADGKLAVLLHLEGTRCFERNLDAVEAFSMLGIRHALLAFNNANSAGGGCMDLVDGGLTAYGRRLIRRLESLGVLVDLSHTGHKTLLEALGYAGNPCIFSHSNVDALFAHPRNLSDEEIKACAACGGVIGISGSTMYHAPSDDLPQSVFAHIDHIAQLVGVEHVGLGLDTMRSTALFNDYMRARPDEWPDASCPGGTNVHTLQPEQLSDVMAHLIDAGYPDSAIIKVLGGNFRRVCETTWPV